MALEEAKPYKLAVEKTRPRVFIFYKKEDVIYIDKHLFCCDAEPFKYNLEFYI